MNLFNPFSWFDSSQPTSAPARPATPANAQPLDNKVITEAQGSASRELIRQQKRSAADAKGELAQATLVKARETLTKNTLEIPVPSWDEVNLQSHNKIQTVETVVSAAPILPKATPEFRDNLLNQYSNYTYHIKLWITNEPNAEQINNLTSVNATSVANYEKITIAESGVTAGFNIQKFTFRNLAGTTDISRSMPSFSWNMTITEPFGFSLPDRINSGAQQYGIANWQRAKYFIEIWFTGYNEDGSPVESHLFYKLFCVTIVEMSLGGNETGGTYEITGLVDGGVGNTNDVMMSLGAVTATGSTMGEIVKSLADGLNTVAKQMAVKETAPLTMYDIKIPTDMEKWQLDTGQVLTNDSTGKALDSKITGSKVVIIMPVGTGIDLTIDYIISLTKEFENWQKGDATGTTSGIMTHGLTKRTKLHTRVEYVGFDLRAGEYVRKITYTLIPYEEVRIRADIATSRNAETPSVQLNKIDYLVTQKRISKKYEWIYTGQNTEVIRVDFKVNNFWTISTVPFRGFNTASNQVVGKIADTTTSSWEQATLRYKLATSLSTALAARKKTEQDLINNGSSLWSAIKGDPLLDQERRIEQAKIYAVTTERLISENNQSLAQIEKDRIIAYSNDFYIPFNGTVAGAAVNNPAYKQLQDRKNKFISDFKSGPVFAEDIHINDVDTTFPFVNTIKPDAKASPANSNQAAASAKIRDTTTPGSIPASRTLFGGVVGNLDSVNKEMMNITIDIRGDPYWMGHSNVEQNSVVPNNLRTLDKDFAEYLGGDNMFYLIFRSGQAPNEETGFMEFTSDNQFVNGYYAVTEVTNNFQAGQFTQTLKSFKDTQSQHANKAAEQEISRASKILAARTPLPKVTPTTEPKDGSVNGSDNAGGYNTITGSSSTPVFNTGS